MAQYERNRVLVDQCTECKGIFLDRGEFDHLVEAEKAFYATPSPTSGPLVGGRSDDRPVDNRRTEDRSYPDRPYEDRPYEGRRYEGRPYEDRRYDDRDRRRGDDRSYKKRKRSSMLEELFDF
jgi:Zn-finger nucleic acid-binding protein